MEFQNGERVPAWPSAMPCATCIKESVSMRAFIECTPTFQSTPLVNKVQSSRPG